MPFLLLHSSLIDIIGIYLRLPADNQPQSTHNSQNGCISLIENSDCQIRHNFDYFQAEMHVFGTEALNELKLLFAFCMATQASL